MKRTSILCFLAIVTTAASAWSQANTTAAFSNFSLNATTQNAILFRNAAGTPLSQGTAAANNDGTLIQLGYYSAATAANNFAGTWIPITGAFGTPLPTTVGDSGTSATGSGNGVADFVAVFGGAFLNTTNVQVYPGDPKTYVTQSSVPITVTQPPNNQIMSIRFYDTTSGLTGNFNAVSADDWLWQVPTTAGGGAVVNYILADNFTGSGAALEFQDAANPFKTTIAIPEPTTFALLGFGALAVIGLRRRSSRSN